MGYPNLRNLMVLILAVFASSAITMASVDIAAGVNYFDPSDSGICLDFSTNPVPYDFFGGGSEQIDWVIELEVDSLELDPRFSLSRAALSIETPATPAPPAPPATPATFASFNFSMPVLVSSGIVVVEFDSMDIPGLYQIMLVPAFDEFPGQLAISPSGPDGTSGGTLPADGDGDGVVDSGFDLDYVIYFNETCGCSSKTLRVFGESLMLNSYIDYDIVAPQWAADTGLAAGFFPGVDPLDNSSPQLVTLSGSRLKLSMTLAAVEPDPSIAGDANLNGTVDLDDFIILKQNYGSLTANWMMGDFNGDGAVNLDDFIILKQNYGQSAQ